VFFWNSPVVYPIKVFTTVLHESGHVLAALLTGGSISDVDGSDPDNPSSFSISSDMSGFCKISGGMRCLVIPAGYVGSIVLGLLIFIVALKTRLSRLLAFTIGIGMVAIALFYVRTTFGLSFMLAFGVGMMAIARYAPSKINKVFLEFLGITSALYAFINIKEYLVMLYIASSTQKSAATAKFFEEISKSDAYTMSQIIPFPPVVWGVIWGLFAIIVACYMLKIALKNNN